jgi:hypothetical protein
VATSVVGAGWPGLVLVAVAGGYASRWATSILDVVRTRTVSAAEDEDEAVDAPAGAASPAGGSPPAGESQNGAAPAARRTGAAKKTAARRKTAKKGASRRTP